MVNLGRSGTVTDSSPLKNFVFGRARLLPSRISRCLRLSGSFALPFSTGWKWEQVRAGLRPAAKHCHMRSLAVPRRGARTRQLRIDKELEAVSKSSNRGTQNRGTGVSPVREKILLVLHRRDVCATMKICNAAIWLNGDVF